jgi:tetratricopeptide (TPR) repeat protein
VKTLQLPIILLVVMLLVAACASTPTGNVEATVAAAVAATQAAQPTDTPIPPTHTPTPTETPVPPTATLVPTNTPVPPTKTPQPTNTPKPTNTSTPTDTPALPTETSTPVPPTFTPTIAVSAAEEHLEQGLAYFEQEKWDEAITEFQQAIQLDPELGVAYGGLGYSYALGKQDFERAILALEKYLQLVPTATDRAEVEADIQKMRELAAQPASDFDIPPGKALFYFANYSGEQWNVDIGSYFLEVPPNPPGQEYNLVTIIIEPGTYTWQAHSANAGYYITDSNGNKAFEFTVAAGEAYGTSCCR